MYPRVPIEGTAFEEVEFQLNAGRLLSFEFLQKTMLIANPLRILLYITQPNYHDRVMADPVSIQLEASKIRQSS